MVVYENFTTGRIEVVAKVMFLLMSVILFPQGGLPQTPPSPKEGGTPQEGGSPLPRRSPRRRHPLGKRPPRRRHPPGRRPPPGPHPRGKLRGSGPGPHPRGNLRGIRSQAHTQRGNWGGSDPGPNPRGKLRGIRSRPTPKGEIEGDHIQRLVRTLLECILVFSYALDRKF